MKPFLLHLLLIVCLCSCQKGTKPIDEVQGIWIEMGYSSDKKCRIVAIEDSTATYNPWGLGRYSSPLMTPDDVVTSYDPHWDKHSILTKSGDTLIEVSLHDSSQSKYLKAEPDVDTIEYLYNDLYLKVDLPLWKNTEHDSLEFHGPPSLIANLGLGPLKKGETPQYSDLPQDSVLIQVHDVLLALNDLDIFVNSELAKVPYEERDRLTFVIHADRSAPSELIDRLRQEIRRQEGSHVVRAYFDKTSRKVRWAEWPETP